MKKNIMIKSAIAAAIVAATTATTIADTTLYGRFRAGVVCTDDGTTDDCGLENRSSRFGIKVDQEISDGLSAFGKYEFEVRLDEGSIRAKDDVNNAARRLSYVGLKGGFGEISVGSRWTPMYSYVASPIDPTQLLGGSWSYTGFASGFRKADTVNYKNKFGTVGMHVQLQMDDGDAGNDAVDEFQIGAGGKLGPVNLGVAYQDTTDVGTVVGVHGGTKFGTVGLGVSYYNVSTDAVGGTMNDKAEGDYVHGLVSYGLGGGKTINFTAGTDMPSASGSAEPLMVSAEYEHKLSKNFRWFAAVENTDTDTAADDVVKYGAGMRLEF